MAAQQPSSSARSTMSTTASTTTNGMRTMTSRTAMGTRYSNFRDEDVAIETIQEKFMFPLFSEMSRICRSYRSIELLLIIILVFQSLGTFFFTCSKHVWPNYEKDLPMFIKFCAYFTNLGVFPINQQIKNNNLTDSSNKNNGYGMGNAFMYQYIFVFCAFVAEIIYIAFLMYWYKVHRSYNKLHLWIFHIVCYFFNLIITLPCASLCANAALRIDLAIVLSKEEINGNKNGQIITIGFFVASLLVFIYFFVFSMVSIKLQNDSPFLNRSLIGLWESKVLLLIFFNIQIVKIIQIFFNLFSNYLIVILILFSFGMNLFESYLCFFNPSLHIYTNSLLQGLICLFFYSSIFSFIKVFAKDILPNIVFIIIPILLSAASIIAYQIFQIKRKNRIIEELNQSTSSCGQNLLTDAEKNEYFRSLNIKSVDDALMYLHIGIEFHCSMVVDFSYVRFMMEKQQTQQQHLQHNIFKRSLFGFDHNYLINKVNFSLLQAAALFPSQQQFLSLILSEILKSDKTYNIFQNYMIYQVRRIHIIRQSSVSAEANKELLAMQKRSMATIAQLRGFWIEVVHSKKTISVSNLQHLRRISKTTDSKFLDAIEQFPNSQSLLEEYCRFLIEAAGDYQSAIMCARRVKQIDSGKHVSIDHAFRIFINTYPSYIKEKILDVSGQPIQHAIRNNGITPNIFRSNSSLQNYSSDDIITMNTISSETNNNNNNNCNNNNCNNNNNSNNDDQIIRSSSFINNLSTGSFSSFDTDIAVHDESIINELFDHGKLRLALCGMMKNKRLPTLKLAKMISIANCVAAIITSLLIIFCIPIASKKPLSLIKSTFYVARLLSSLQYSGCIAAGRFIEGMVEPGETIEGIFKKALCISKNDMPSWPSLFNQPILALHITKESFIEDLGNEMNLITQNDNDHIAEIIKFTNFRTNPHIFVLLGNANQTYIPQTLKSAISMYAGTIESFVSHQKNTESIVDSKGQLLAFEIIVNSVVIGQTFSEIFKSITQNGISLCESTSNTIDIICIVLCVVACIFMISTRCYTHYKIYSNLKTSSELMSKIKPNDIQETQKHVYKKKIKTVKTTSHFSHEFSITMIIYPFISVLSIVVPLFYTCYACFGYSKSLNFIKKSFDWSGNAALRFSSILQMMLATVASKIQGTDDASTIVGLALSVNDLSEKLNLGIIGQNEMFDDTYFVDTCKPSSLNYSSYLDCLCLSNKLNIGINYLFSIVFSKDTSTSIFRTIPFTGNVFMIDKYFYKELREFQSSFVTFASERFEMMKMEVIKIGIIGLIISLLFFILEIYTINSLNTAFEGYKQLVLMLPPSSLARNTEVFNFIVGYEVKKDNSNLKTSEAIIFTTKRGVLLTDPSFVIQKVNKSVQDISGYTPDQLLGQHLSFLIPVPTKNKTNSTSISTNIDINDSPLYSKLEEFKLSKRKKEKVFEVKAQIIDEGSNLIPVKITIVAIMDDVEVCRANGTLNQRREERSKNNNKKIASFLNKKSSANNQNYENENNSLIDENDENEYCGDLSSFVFLISDLQSETKQKKEMNNAKIRSETLMKALVPEQLVKGLIIKENKSVYNVNEATLIQIEIDGISDLVNTITPKQFMENMETIYKVFDSILLNFPSIHPVRSDSDNFVAVLGLFDNVDKIEFQAENAVDFCLELLKRREELNEQLGIEIVFGIGIHIGKLSGCIMDPKTPLFDINGEVIRFAKEMQLYGKRNKVQITEHILKYLKKADYNIEYIKTLEIEGEKHEIIEIIKKKEKDFAILPSDSSN